MPEAVTELPKQQRHVFEAYRALEAQILDGRVWCVKVHETPSGLRSLQEHLYRRARERHIRVKVRMREREGQMFVQKLPDTPTRSET